MKQYLIDLYNTMFPRAFDYNSHTFVYIYKINKHSDTRHMSSWWDQSDMSYLMDAKIFTMRIDTGTNGMFIIRMKCKSLCFIHISMTTADFITNNK